jgi:methylated-DNA-protein-cysteine methyltransferase-like protein
MNIPKKRSDFSEKVIAAIRKIPKGKVATYGQIAGIAGKTHAARGVSWILHSSSKAEKLPWQRVLNSKGRISFPKGSTHYAKQKRLLQKEGVLFLEDDEIDLVKFQWKKKAPAKTSLRNRPSMFK